MQPIVMRLLGASEPKTDEGTIAGKASAAPAVAAERVRNSLRVIGLAFLVILLSMKLSFRHSSEKSAGAKKRILHALRV